MGIYCNGAGIKSAEKQAQKLASQMALKEFSWQDWQANKSEQKLETVGYWVSTFEAAINTDISRLRSTFKPIALLAIPGTVFSFAIIAVLLKYGLGMNWISSLFIGTCLANTDTVSIIAVFKQISVPSKLSTIVEGETLFNDTAALVLFNLVLTYIKQVRLRFSREYGNCYLLLWGVVSSG